MAEEFEAASEDVVEKAKADRAKSGNIFSRTILFFKQVVQELSKVTRPTPKELLNYTGVVMAFVLIVMFVIFGLDALFTLLVQWAFTPSAV
ncbi:MAG: preprotein translocase subunit SecE [Micrococcales bacterium]